MFQMHTLGFTLNNKEDIKIKGKILATKYNARKQKEHLQMCLMSAH